MITYRSVIWYTLMSVLLCTHTNGFTSSNFTTLLEEFRDQNWTGAYYSPLQYSYTPSCDMPASPKFIALASFNSAVAVLGLLGNLLVILVIQYSQLRMQPGYALVTSLAVADLGVSFFVTIVKVKNYLENRNFCSSLAFCVFQSFTDTLFPTASITHLLFICINRFCAITSPYSYHALVTNTKEMFVVFSVWVYCLLWTTASMIRWDNSPKFAIDVLTNGPDKICYSNNPLFYACAAICVFIIPVIAAGILYIIIVLIAQEKIQSVPGLIGESLDQLPENNQLNQTRSSSAKGATTLMTVFTAWVVCWMPHFSLILANYFDPESLMQFREDHKLLVEFLSTIISDVLPCLNSCINPFIYFLTSSTFQHALKDSWLKLQKKPRHREGSTVFLKCQAMKRQISETVKATVASLASSRPNC